MSKIPKSVSDVLDSCADVVSSFERDSFHVDTYFETFEFLDTGNGKISPIEQIIYVAMKAVFQIISVPQSEPYYDINGHDRIGNGYYIIPQPSIGKYRVDFIIGFVGVRNRKQYRKEVIVECDGHEFHDKDKKQRAFEKARDRYFQKEGKSILHYTGSEIVTTPIHVAAEIISFLNGETKEDILGQYEQYSEMVF